MEHLVSQIIQAKENQRGLKPGTLAGWLPIILQIIEAILNAVGGQTPPPAPVPNPAPADSVKTVKK